MGHILFIENKHNTHKNGGGGIRVLGVWRGSSFLDFPSLLDSLVVCMCCCNPSPFPHVSLMYINPDSRGQCVLGEVKLLSSHSITFSLHSSAWVLARALKCVLLFQRRDVYLELIRGTQTGPSGLEHARMSVYMLSFIV